MGRRIFAGSQAVIPIPYESRRQNTWIPVGQSTECVTLNTEQKALYQLLSMHAAARKPCVVQSKGNGMTALLALFAIDVLNRRQKLVYVCNSATGAATFWFMVKMYLPEDKQTLMANLALAIAPPEQNLLGVKADIFLVDHLPSIPILLLPFAEMPELYNESTVLHVLRV